MNTAERRLHDAKLGAAIENATSKLPEDWMVNIFISLGGHSVSLLDPFGNEVELDDSDNLVDDINSAVAEAIVGDSMGNDGEASS